MSNKIEANQPGLNAPEPLKLTLEAGVFNAELKPIVGKDKVGWPNDDHIRLVEGIIPKLTDENGKTPVLTKEHWNNLRLIFRPTEDLQRAVLRQTFAAAGYTLDSAAEKALTLLLSAQQFADFLANTENPDTKKPFIQKEKKRGAKKSTFASLISVTNTVTEPVSSKAPVTTPPREESAKEAELNGETK